MIFACVLAIGQGTVDSKCPSKEDDSLFFILYRKKQFVKINRAFCVLG